MIPESVVEAAALAYLGHESSRNPVIEAWAMRAALNAAAPHFKADAWDEGAAATDDYERKWRVAFDFGDDLPEPPPNPYRSQA